MNARAAHTAARSSRFLFAARPGDLIVLNNPHNPTGACFSRAEMLDRLDAARANGCFVLADEAFIDYAPHAAITREAATRSGVVAIRSLTKFFGCPGLARRICGGSAGNDA